LQQRTLLARLKNEAVGEKRARQKEWHTGARELDRYPLIANVRKIEAFATRVKAAVGKVAATEKDAMVIAGNGKRPVDLGDQRRETLRLQPKKHDVAVGETAGNRPVDRNDVKGAVVWVNRLEDGPRGGGAAVIRRGSPADPVISCRYGISRARKTSDV